MFCCMYIPTVVPRGNYIPYSRYNDMNGNSNVGGEKRKKVTRVALGTWTCRKLNVSDNVDNVLHFKMNSMGGQPFKQMMRLQLVTYIIHPSLPHRNEMKVNKLVNGFHNLLLTEGKILLSVGTKRAGG